MRREYKVVLKRNSGRGAGFTPLVTAPLRTITAGLLGALALAAPASATTVFEYQGHGKLAPREMKALPPRKKQNVCEKK